MTKEQATALFRFIRSMDGDEVAQADIGSDLYDQLTTQLADYINESLRVN